MKDEEKTKEQLLTELALLRQLVAESEKDRKASTDDAKLHRRAEERLTAKKTETGRPQTKEDTERLHHELQVHQVELEMQNEQLCFSQADLKESRTKYLDLYDFAPVGYLTLDEKGVIKEANLTLAGQVGVERGHLIESPFQKYMSKEDADKFYLHLNNVFENKKRQTCEVGLVTRGGVDLWVRLDSIFVQDADDKELCRTSVIDITERRKIEERQRKEVEWKNLLLWLYEKAPQLPDKELYDYVLERAVQLTESTIGFFHLVSDDQKNIILTTWNSEAVKNCTASYATHYPIEQAGNWVDCVRFKRPIVYNDFPNSPNRKGLPEGHSHVRRFMSVPVMEEDKVRIIFGVGNKSEEYDEHDVMQIQLAANDLQNIIKQRRSELVLRESQQRLNLALKSSKAGTWDRDIAADKAAWDEHLHALFGLVPGTFSGKLEDFLGMVHPDDRERVRGEMTTAIDGEADYATTFRVIWPDSSVHFIADRGKVYRDGAGRAVRMTGVNLDVTELKQAEEALKESQQQLVDIINFLPDATLVINKEGKVIAWNRAIEEMTGIKAADILGRGNYEYALPFYGERRPILIDLVLQRREEIEAKYVSIERKESVLAGEAYMPALKGGEAYLFGTASILHDSKGNVVGAIESLRDITERKQAEEELARYRDHLEELVKERTAELVRTNEQLTHQIEERMRAEEALKDASEKLKLFAYSVAHDLKSPAIGVYGLTKRLNKHAKDVLDEKGRNYCDQILKLAEHIAALVDKVNVYVATKETRLSIEKINVGEILQMLKDEFSVRLSIRQIDWRAPETTAEIKADRLSMLRAFRNFVDNSLKYGGESLSTIWTGYDESEDFHIFSFSDNGKGLKEESAEKIFGAFQRNETSRGVEGAGLGLTIVKEIAEQHGGTVWVEPRSKKGTTFYLSISKNL